jgi:hypothetical protein
MEFEQPAVDIPLARTLSRYDCNCPLPVASVSEELCKIIRFGGGAIDEQKYPLAG